MATVELTRGLVAVIDDEDAERVRALGPWHPAVKCRYAESKFINGKRFLLHVFVMNPPNGMEVDHKNGNGLDCRKENLRVCTHAQNRMNSKRYISQLSKFTGVRWNSTNRKWVAEISHEGKSIHIGSFDDEVFAAEARDLVAVVLRGEFARLNFPVRA